MRVFWYLGSPYSKYPGGIHLAFVRVCQEAALLIKAGIPVFSPIAHSHPIAVNGEIDPFDHNIWLPADKLMMDAAKGLIVCKLPGWAASYGLSEEIKYFAGLNLPVVYMNPGEIPDGLH